MLFRASTIVGLKRPFHRSPRRIRKTAMLPVQTREINFLGGADRNQNAF